MDAQRTPDELSSENSLICEKLLNWIPVASVRGSRWRRATDTAFNFEVLQTPSFATWAEAGLILDALAGRTVAVESVHAGLWACRIFKSPAFAYGDTGPQAVRAAALEYIRSKP